MNPEVRREIESLKKEIAELKNRQSPINIENIDDRLVTDIRIADTTNLLSNGTTDSLKMPPNVLIRRWKNRVGLVPFYDLSDK